MSDFSADWLGLREPVDHRSRNPELLAALAQHLKDRVRLNIVDLGCGTGSNLRALAAHLPHHQHWTLVDRDPALLAAARLKLAAFGDAAAETAGGFSLLVSNRALTVSFREADLAAGPEGAIGAKPDLVTAAALFDLVSPDYIARFAEAVAAKGAAFYTALTYDGRDIWEPPHPGDAAVMAAFHAHQGRDKGLGPAAGPQATEVLAEAFRRHGYAVTTGDSAWRLGPADAALTRQLARGTAQAVAETGEVPEADLLTWRQARVAGATCLVGHLDLLALPPRAR